jgi:hypothetical protein
LGTSSHLQEQNGNKTELKPNPRKKSEGSREGERGIKQRREIDRDPKSNQREAGRERERELEPRPPPPWSALVPVYKERHAPVLCKAKEPGIPR